LIKKTVLPPEQFVSNYWMTFVLLINNDCCICYNDK